MQSNTLPTLANCATTEIGGMCPLQMVEKRLRPPAPFVLGGFRIHGNDCEISCSLPGLHPIGAIWWEDLNAWFVVRGVARPFNARTARTPIAD